MGGGSKFHESSNLGNTSTSGDNSSMGNASNTNFSTSGSTADRLLGQSDTATGPAGNAQGSTVTGGIHPEHETEKTGVTSMHSNDPKYQDQSLSSSNATSNRGVVGGTGAVDSSVGSDPSSGQKFDQKQQGADRPNVAPTGDDEEAVKSSKAKAERAAENQLTGGGPKDKSTGEGTGEKWVKTTGMAAEGGDFDASKPGAGREADRKSYSLD